MPSDPCTLFRPEPVGNVARDALAAKMTDCHATYTAGMELAWVWVVAAFVAGLLLGSFLNVCISRLPYGESVVRPRSHCPSCLHPIAWYDNVPLLSWAVLRAKCRKCGQAISWRYPAVELAVGLWFAWVASRGLSADVNTILGAVGALILGWLLIGLMVMDWQTHRLPDAFTLTGCVIGFLLVCTQAIFLPQGVGDIHLHKSMRMSSPGSMVERGDMFLSGTEVMVFGRLAAIVGAALLLLAIRALYKAVRKQEGLGLGDVKLLAMMAAFLGFWPAMLALFVGVMSASVYAVVLLARGRAHAMSRLPLGSFLAFGGLVAAVVGTPVIAWYSSLLR